MEEWQYFDEEPTVARSVPQQPPVSNLKKAGQFAGGLLTRAVQAPFNAVELPANIVGAITGRKPISEPISERIGRGGKKLFGDIEPENIVSKGLQYTAGNWPFLFLGGAPTAAKVGADIAGSTALAASEKISNNPLLGIGAHILGQRGFSQASNYLKKAPVEPGKIRNYISDLYNSEKELGSKIAVKPDNVEKKLGIIFDDVKKEYLNPGKFDEAARNRVVSNLKNAEESLSKPHLTASDLSSEKRRLNKAWASRNSIENGYYNRIKDAFKEELDDISKNHSDWSKAYKTSDELYKIDKWQSNLGRWVDNMSSKGKLSSLAPNPLTQSALAVIGGVYKGTPYALLGAAAPAVGKAAVKGFDVTAKAGQFLSTLSQNPSGRKLLMEIVADSAKENSAGINKSIHKLNKFADKYEKSENEWQYFD